MKLLRRLFSIRLDILYRIVVFLSMITFLIMPSYILYQIKDYNNYMNIVIPSIVVLGVLLGTGTLAIQKPLKTTFFYFVEVVFVLLIYTPEFVNTPDVHSEQSVALTVFIIEVIYSSLGALLGFLYFLKVLTRSRINHLDEGTNHDNLYDFLNARDSNKEIKEDIDKIAKEGNNQIIFFWSKAKLSRILRFISSFVILITSAIYFTMLVTRDGNGTNYALFKISLLAFFITLILTIFSALYPKSFKYIYYFNAIFFSICLIITTQNANMNSIVAIGATIFVFISFLITLIVDGRTWTGADPD